ncbi:MAG: dimethyl sulfoxide reductase anchor subunit family protein [Pseudomonadota bacterium]|uniref:dimethyl sulfoxide reductase anchor subunit family protein n=1 Tax=Thermithiobacillus tepidarius TaxID=929 RepID=UPI0003FA2E4D|nr:DmsC/YnfH family molybdoenzyme membrane anchor subunit [Thermithiobacillus tepidarius]
MHASLSTIFLTLLSGGGFGLMSLIVLANWLRLGGGLTVVETLVAGIIALALVSAGLISSTLHLANPKNAWRAFTRWRTSWLAREGVFAVAFYPFALLYLAATWIWNTPDNLLAHLAGAGALFFSVITVFSQGMIYAVLRTIRQWNTPLVPTNFLFLGAALGATTLAAVRLTTGGAAGTLVTVAVMLLFMAAVIKTIYYFWIAQPGGPTINTATGFTRATVRILDPGHTAGTFLTEEFGNTVPAQTAMLLKVTVYVLGFIVPAWFLYLALNGGPVFLGPAAALSAFVGIFVERWLFWAEAQHVVNLYHGRQQC